MSKSDYNKVAFKIAFPDGCFPENLLHVFKTPFPKNTSERLLLVYVIQYNLL